MNRPLPRKPPFVFAAVSLAMMLSSGSCLAWSLVAQPVEGILVLRNGNVLRGKVQQQGEHYQVHVPNGKLQVREQQVEMFCRNLEEAYLRRRESRVGSSADSHLELAAWCLRHDLLSHAETELEAARSIDPDHERLGLLQRQLKNVLRMAKIKEEQQLAEQTVAPEPEPLDPSSLEKAPQWARALFVRQIQPLMVHSCAAGGCHQAGTESEFQLNRLAVDGAGHPDATLRNLAATLKQIDWETADHSRLLERAKKAHGSNGMAEPLPLHKLQVLQGWVAQLTEANQKKQTLMTLPQLADEEPKSPPLELKPPQQLVPQPKALIRTASYEAKDPFDPAVFNDRYAAKKKAVAEPPVVRLASRPDAVPHVLVPDQPAPIPLPVVE